METPTDSSLSVTGFHSQPHMFVHISVAVSENR